MSIPITQGTGASSVATEVIGTQNYQQIKVIGGETGSTSVMGVTPDGAIKVSVLGTPNVNVSGSVFATLSGSGSVIAISQGSVTALQGSPPWAVTNVGSIISLNIGSVITTNVGSVIAIVQGSVAALNLSSNASFIGVSKDSSVLSVPVGSTIAVLQAPSVVGTYAEDAAHTSGEKGFFVMQVRNDTMASITSADGDYSPIAGGPVGETITANAPLTKWVQGTADLRGAGSTGSSVIVIAAQGSSVFTYITGVQAVNLGSASVLVTLAAGGSTLGYTIAPAGGGSNIVYPNALKTPANFGFAASISGVASVLVSAQGFVAKV